MLKLIAVIEQNFGLSLKGTIPWEFRVDRFLFQQLTINSTIIMGRHTFFSHKNFPLKNRKNIVITKSKIPNTLCFSHIEKALETEPNAWIIGGAQLYNYALENNLVDLAVITHLHKTYESDTFLKKNYLERLQCVDILSFTSFDIKILKK